MVASSTNSATKGKQHTGKTSSPKADDAVMPSDVAIFFQTAANYAQKAGMQIVADVQDGKLILAIEGLTLIDGQISAVSDTQ